MEYQLIECSDVYNERIKKNYKHGAFHFKDKSMELFNLDGEFHRIGNPASIIHNRNGDLIYECYFLYDQIHRENGPAEIHYGDGEIKSKYYYLYNIQYSEEEYYQQMETKLYW